MRLIDLDEAEEMLSIPYPNGVESILTEYRNIPTILENFKKIEAIPTDWIYKWALEKDISTDTTLVICDMVEEWRKQNESNTDN